MWFTLRWCNNEAVVRTERSRTVQTQTYNVCFLFSARHRCWYLIWLKGKIIPEKLCILLSKRVESRELTGGAQEISCLCNSRWCRGCLRVLRCLHTCRGQLCATPYPTTLTTTITVWYQLYHTLSVLFWAHRAYCELLETVWPGAFLQITWSEACVYTDNITMEMFNANNIYCLFCSGSVWGRSTLK